MYQITEYSKNQAEKLGVQIKLSTNSKKKLDVFKDNIKIASIGAIGYGDYPTFINLKGKEYAENKRRLYKLRHSKDRNIVGSNGYFADRLLWWN